MIKKGNKIFKISNAQGGNIFALLFAAVAMVGVLGVIGMQTMSGPVRTITKVTQKNIADNDIMLNGRIVILNAATLAKNTSDNPGPADPSWDGDYEIEPVAFNTVCNGNPTGGGCLPTDIGAVLTDPWGTNYGYCAWDHGTTNSSANMLDGDTLNARGAAVAIISAGPDKTFNTTCSNFSGVGATMVQPNVGSGNRVIGTDDLAKIFTYQEAVAGAGGLWSLSGNDAVIGNAAVTDDIVFGGGASVDIATGGGAFPAIQTDFLSSLTGGNTPVSMSGGLRLDDQVTVVPAACAGAGTAGILRWNTSGRVEVCDGTTFVNVATAGGEPWRIFDNGNTWVSTETTSGAGDDIINFTTNGATAMTISATGVIDIVGNADVGANFTADGDVTLGDALTDTTAITGIATVGATLGVTGVTTLADDLIVDTDVLFVDASANTVGVNNASPSASLDVTGNFNVTTTATVGTNLTVNGNSVLGNGAGDLTTVFEDLNVGRDTTIANDLTVDTNTLLVDATNDRVGIGGAPAADTKLDVSGIIKLGSGTCSATSIGSIQYTALNNIQYCNGTSWQSISGVVARLRDVGNVESDVEDTNGYVLQWDSTLYAGTGAWKAVAPSSLAAASSTNSDNAKQLIDGSTNGNDTWVRVTADPTGFANNDIIRMATVGTERLRIESDGDISIGSGVAPDASSILDITSTTKGMLPPRMTTAERNAIASPANGLLIFNTTTKTLEFYDGVGTAWVSFATSAGAAAKLADTDGNTQIQVEEGANDDTIRFDTAGTERMTISPTGVLSHIGDAVFDTTTLFVDSANNRIGVGTITPLNDIDVHNTGNTANFSLSNGGDSQTMLNLFTKRSDTTKYLGEDATNKGWFVTAYSDTNGTAAWRNDLRFTHWNGATYVGNLSLDSLTGNVGINAATPLSPLHIIGTSISVGSGDFNAGTDLMIEDTDAHIEFISDNTGNTGSALELSEVNAGTFADKWSIVRGTTTGGTGPVLSMYHGSNVAFGSNNLIARFTPNAQLGLGTSPADSAALDVTSTTRGFLPPRMTTVQRDAIASPATGLLIYNTTVPAYQYYNGSAWISFATSAGTAKKLADTDGNTQIQVEEGANDDTIRFDTAGTERMTISPTGAVTINASTGVELTVTGDIRYSGVLTDTSDRRLKTDITPLEADDILSRVTKIDTYTFKMKNDASGRIEYGVMAQELEKLFPELVQTADDEMGTKSVNYMGLIAPMIESVKILKSDNDMLHAQINEIQSAQAAMAKQIQDLKSQTVMDGEKTDYDKWLLLGMLMIIAAGAVFFIGACRNRCK